MSSFFSCTGVGRVKDVVVKENYASFTLATDEWIYKDGKTQSETQWHKCFVQGPKLVERFAKVVGEKDLIAITNSSIRYSEKDGKYYTNIIVKNFTVISKYKESAETASSPGKTRPPEKSVPEDDDLPFKG